MTFSSLLQILDHLVFPTIAGGVWVLSSIRRELHQLNGKVIDLHRWTRDHEKLDDERHKAASSRIDELREDIKAWPKSRAT